MIISFKHKFIHIHISKCAGSTIRNFLISNLYPHAFSNNKILWKNIPINETTFFSQWTNSNSKDLDQHSSFSELESYLDKKQINLDEFFVFSSVRNPWERILSSYFYEKKHYHRNVTSHPDFSWYGNTNKDLHKPPDMTFYSYVKNWLPDSPDSPRLKSRRLQNSNGLASQYSYLLDNNKNFRANFLARQEELQNGFDFICDKLKVNKMAIKKTNQTKHKHYTEYYDDETRQIVAQKYAKDIEYFGYNF